MKFFEGIFNLALAILLIVTALIAVFGAGEIVSTTLQYYIFDVVDCTYYPMDKPMTYIDQPRECTTDYSQAKRNLANGIAQIIIAGPVAYFMFRRLRKHYE